MRGSGAVIKRTLVSFYDDQMTHHAAALTYYALMSLFPDRRSWGSRCSASSASIRRPTTRSSATLRDVAPDSVVTPLDSSLRSALQHKGTAATALAISVAVALYGTTGVLEAARRALNVVFEIESGRSFLRRKAIDIASTVVLLALALVSRDPGLRRRALRRRPARLHRARPDRRDDLEHRALAGGAASSRCSCFPSSTTSRPTCSSAPGAG